MKAVLLAVVFATYLAAQNLSFYLDPSNGGQPPSQLTPLPAIYNFADTPAGSSTSTVIRVVNNGATAAAVSFFYVGSAAGATAATTSFTVTGYPLGSVVAPNNFKLLTLNFTPRALGQATGYLQANIGGLPVSIATLTGSGTAPQVTLSCRSSVSPQCSGAVLQPSTTAPINFGNTLTTATVVIPFTLTNNSAVAVNPQVLVSLATTTNNPNTPFNVSALPATLAANAAVTFNVTFAPGTTQTFLINLTVGGINFPIQGTGIASILGDISSLLITYTDSTGIRLTAQPGTPLSFGQITSGTTGGANTLTFLVANPQLTISAVTVPAISVTGPGFSIAGAPALPASIPPGNSLTFKLVFTPSQTGTFNGTLAIGSRQFSVTAQATTSPVPDASFSLDLQPLVSGKQAHVSVHLAAASTISSIGVLSMAFTPLVMSTTDDPAIHFVATSGRELQVDIAGGAQIATYNGASALTFQTGTTAGTLSFTLTLPDKAPFTQSFTIAPAAVQIVSGTAVRQPPNLVITLTGYDNTYSAGPLTYAFLDSSGKALTPSALSVDASAKFHTYFFTNNQVGGAFSIQASFPVIGDITKVASAAITLTNSNGPTTVTQTFQ